MKSIESFCGKIETINTWVNRIFAWLLIPLTLLVTMEVILRYVFIKPTIWVWDVNIQLLGVLAVMGGGYALLHGSHVAVDVLATRLHPRKRAVLNLITSVFFFAAVGVILWQTILGAWSSWLIKETTVSFFAPPIYPFKWIMVAGVTLLLLQGFVKFLRDLAVATATDSGRSL